MKKVLPILLVLVVVAVALFFTLSKSKPAGAITLEMKYKVGQVDKYQINMDMDIKMDVPGMPSGSRTQKMNMSMIMTQKVQSINPDGSAKVNYSISDGKMTMPGSAMPAPPIPNMEFTANMGKDGKMLSMESASNPAMMGVGGVNQKQMLGQLAASLPKTAVGVGSSWDGSVDMPMGGVMAAKYTLVSDNEPVGNAKTAKIAVDINYDGDLADWAKKAGPSGAMMAGMKGKINMNGTGNQYFDYTEGKLVKGDADIKMKMEMEMPAGMAGATSAAGKMQMDMAMVMHMNKID